MQPDGWVKLYRKTQKSDMYKNLNSVQRDVMINCLMLANHKSNKWEWNGEIFEADPGQFITSLSSLKDVCAKDVSIQNIRTALKKLEKWDFLTNKSTKSGRLITVVNWGRYQSDKCKTNKASNKQVTKSQQSTNKELTTNKNVKNDKNDKNDKELSNIVPKNEIDKTYNSLSDYWQSLFKDYIDIYRQKNKTKKITDNKHLRLLKELKAIFESKSFKFDGQNYDLSEKIFEKGIEAIVEKQIDNLNYAKQVWISGMEKEKKRKDRKKRKKAKAKNNNNQSNSEDDYKWKEFYIDFDKYKE